MNSHSPRFAGAVLLSLLLALALNSLPITGWWSVWHPDWMVLTLIHWAVVMRQKVNLILIFFIGLLADVMTHSLLGQHALGYVLVSYIAVRLSLRMSAEAFLQQFALVFIVIGIYMLMNMWIRGRMGTGVGGMTYWAPLITGLLLWPIYHSLLGSYFSTQRKMI
ncbi:rod shape-determining protein MreD [Thiolinea disciformis]|uniref:rod shape-determining protein MreD n=1 Tax=Thiolinea disciformis TaxID=125614 RepID=UPI00035F2881|nr:rod shape-determining protein MreD [Thiolinea disciformis]